MVTTTAVDRQTDRVRAQEIVNRKIEFISSDEFESMLATKEALRSLENVATKRTRAARRSTDGHQLACLAPALNEPLLSFAEEQHEFRRLNFLKFVAMRIQLGLNISRPSRRKMDEFDQVLEDSRLVRDRIIRANLRLVISNAAKYRTARYDFEDLVSDGSMALMEAVDNFDYRRGFRFSTYATLAIRRSFFRKIERKQKDQTRFVVTDPDVMVSAPDPSEVDHDKPAQHRLIFHVIDSLRAHLTERECCIIEARFGLNGRAEPLTLMELSNELGICKERVRQVEGHALEKLRTLAASFTNRPNDLGELVSV